jgi:hypothetical protein
LALVPFTPLLSKNGSTAGTTDYYDVPNHAFG